MNNLRDIFIRCAEPADYVACRKLTNQKDNRCGFGPVSRVTFEDFAQRQKDEPRYILLVAENAKRDIIGYVRALRLKDRSQTTIHEICRDQNMKGHGIGTALLHEVEKRSLHDETRRVFLKSPDGTPANRAYERHGFHMIGMDCPVSGQTRQRSVRLYEKTL